MKYIWIILITDGSKWAITNWKKIPIWATNQKEALCILISLIFFHNWSTLIPIMTPNKHKVVTRENDVVNINWAPFYLHWLPLIPAGIRNDIHCNVWLYRACDFLNLNMLAKGSPDVLYVICVMRVICRNGLASPRQWKIELTFGLLDSEWGGMS